MEISYSFGVIDLLHIGHINVLEKAKQNADLHIFGLVSDQAAREWLGTVISNYSERKTVLENIILIDEIMFQQTFDPLENLQTIHQKYPAAKVTLYHGDDWRILPAEEYLKSIGGKVIFSQYYAKFSPTNILQQLSARSPNFKSISNLISTKANTLIALQGKLKQADIEPIYVTTVGEFKLDSDKVVAEVIADFKGDLIVVRSSSSNEDALEHSNAGHYISLLDIDSADPEQIAEAIQQVIGSYQQDGLLNDNEQVLIQTQTKDVIISGVIFTRDLRRNRPYYLINYNDDGKTDSVTNGQGGKSIWISRDAKDESIPAVWQPLMRTIREMEFIMEDMVLDIEFALTRDERVVIFQVRPLAANYRFAKEFDDLEFFRLKDEVVAAYKENMNSWDKNPMMFSDMAFWNPSEIIGANPHNFDYSLYREIITKRAWNQGLVSMGYREVNQDLMYRLGNKPYISIDCSFLSLTPAALDDSLVQKLLEYYRGQLKQDLTAHDKIEFEIVLNCFDFDTDRRVNQLIEQGFTLEECGAIKQALFQLTTQVIQNAANVLERDHQALATLKNKREYIERKLTFKEDEIEDLINYFLTLIKDIKQYGTPQFVRQARYAFIAKSLCNTMVSAGYIGKEAMADFMLSIETVATSFARDFEDYLAGQMSRETFNQLYGHLRAGTYDVRAARYDQLQFNIIPASSHEPNSAVTRESKLLDKNMVGQALRAIKLDIAEEDFMSFLQSSFEQREYFKFEFTKSLSLAIEIIRKIGHNLGIEINQLSYLDIADILASEYYSSPKELKEFWLALIHQRKNWYQKHSELILPDVILSELDFNIVQVQEARPNFITEKMITGEIIIPEDTEANIEDKIVVLEKADPGFDWIFAKNIKGLITKFGGAASHMAIRCAEFSIPAALGCGEKIYDQISGMKMVKLDCKNGKITEWR